MQIIYSLLSPEFLSRELQRLYNLDGETQATLAQPSYIRFHSRGSNDIYLVEMRDGSVLAPGVKRQTRPSKY